MPNTPVHPAAPDPDHLLSVTTVPGRRPGRAVVEVVGEVDSSTAPLLDACLTSHARRPGLVELVVDLGPLTSLSSAGVRALVRAERRCRSRGARLVIRRGGRRCLLRTLTRRRTGGPARSR